jgi:hypothetical protein
VPPPRNAPGRVLPASPKAADSRSPHQPAPVTQKMRWMHILRGHMNFDPNVIVTRKVKPSDRTEPTRSNAAGVYVTVDAGERFRQSGSLNRCYAGRNWVGSIDLASRPRRRNSIGLG